MNSDHENDATTARPAQGNAASDALLASLVSSSEDAIISTTPEGFILTFNSAAERLYGYSAEEIVGQPISILIPESDREEHNDRLARVRHGERVEHFETVRRKKDGEIIDISLSISPIYSPSGEIAGAASIARDITRKKREEEQQLTTFKYARSLIEASLDPLVTISPEGKIMDVNEAATKATGVPKEELIGTDFSDYFTEPEKARLGYQQVFAKGFVTDYPLTMRRRDGNVTDVLYNASVYHDSRGNVLGVFAAARDITAQRHAAQYARSLIEASLDPLVTISPEGKITDVNEATMKVTGVARDELIGTDFSDYFTESDKAREGYLRVFAEGFVTDYPLTIRHRNGQLTDVLYNASLYRDVQGNVLGVFAAARDVTAQRHAAQYARSLIEASLDPLVTISPEGKITDVNAATVKVTGVARDELIGTDFSDYFTESDKAREGYQQVFAKGFVTDYPLTIRHKDGYLVHVLYNASVYRDVTGNVLGVFAAARDVTAQRHAAQYARSLIEASLDPLVTISSEGKITDVNEATMKVTGAARDELIGTDFSDYFTEPEKAREGYQQVFAEGFVTDYPLTIRHRNGQLMDVLYNASVYRDVQGNVLGVFAAARDVTAQRQAAQYARSLIEASLDPLVTISPEGKITDVNAATVKVTGVASDELVGTDFSDYFTEPEKAREGYQQVFAKGFVTDYPLTIRHRDGQLVDVLYNASVYRDVHGNVLGVFAAARDVTAQRQAAQYARSLIEASLDPLVTISPEGKITDVNAATVKVTGVERDELVGTDFSDYFTEPEKAREGYQQVFAKGFVTDYPLTIRHKEGQLVHVLYNASVYRDVTGNVLGVFAAARDVTAQRHAAQYARSLIEASLDPLVTISPEGKIMDVNEATVKVTGLERDQLVGTDFSDYFTEPEKAREGYRRVFAEGFVTDYPLTIRHRDGHFTDVLYNASVYRDVEGNVLGVFAAARDVTETKRVMREFAETKNFLDNILQSSTKYSIIGKDLNYRILSWNEGARRNYGYNEEEIIGKESTVLHSPEDIEAGVVERMLKTAYDKGLAEGEFQRVRKNGSRFVASVVVTRRNDSAGNPIGYLLMSTDITEKKQAEEKLRYASQYARSLIEASLDPLVTISLEGKITDVNEATAKVTGVPREELIGTDFSDYFTEPEKAREGYEQVFSKGYVTDYPLTIRHRDGRFTSVLYNASVYRDAAGNVLGVFAAARDVTAQREAEAKVTEQRSREEQRARELERLAELERFQKLTVGRELKMVELKKEIEELRKEREICRTQHQQQLMRG
ncbi:PAS domain S-box protein [Geomonas sp. RF6]|uniref:PAS domain S-box protein n=1 Tax=Geomonas sp. RF6 TaxID=2897342 RepID=UPI001E341F75|nr:PAS domain S-box protein [Geomonas sp. RF6]UFS69764.1 PAS domain S-box protein [Geomonas sp. RF6]